MRLITKNLDWIAPREILRRFGSRRGTVLLESVRGGRYSILVHEPVKIVKNLSALEKELKKLPKIKSQLPFVGGAVGFLSYELTHEFEDLPSPKKEVLPRVWFGIYEAGLIWDHEGQALTVVGWNKKSVERLVEQAQNTKCKMQNLALQKKLKIKSNFTRARYLQTIRKIQKLIAAGYTFQVNLSQKFAAKVGQVDSRLIYEKLCCTNPAPFAGYLNAGDFQILSSSPELLFRLQDRKIETWPIAGTRPRGQNSAADKKLEKELKNSAKEQAEHAMLVDLERNDLGRVCEFGSVRVEQFAVVEKYARVQHLVSQISGQLKYPPLSPLKQRGGSALREILRALHPGGTITGCPKVETMKIINALEPSARGAYTGSLGYISASGRMDFNILIRTLNLCAGELSWQAGGGIVADSDPAAEYDETLNKAAALLEAVCCL